MELVKTRPNSSASCDDSLHIRAHPRYIYSQRDQDGLHYLPILTTYTFNDSDRYVTTRNAGSAGDPKQICGPLSVLCCFRVTHLN
jgi:hypothetical protein